MTETVDGKWHLDKKVPISIILVLVFQLVGGLWFLSKLESRIVALETAQIAQSKTDDRQDGTAAAAVSLVRSDIQALSLKLDRMIERAAERSAERSAR